MSSERPTFAGTLQGRSRLQNNGPNGTAFPATKPKPPDGGHFYGLPDEAFLTIVANRSQIKRGPECLGARTS
jgi:hypothetical protein